MSAQPVVGRTVTLADIVEPGGVFVDGDWVESKDQDPEGNVRLVQLADVGDAEYRDRSSRFLTAEKAENLRCTLLERGDLLVARMPDPLGRACIFPGDAKRAVTVVDVAVVRPRNPQVNDRWLMYQLNAPAFRRSVAALQSGSTRQRISRKNLASISFHLPERRAQDATVAEIEKQFSRLDEAVANLQRVKANLKRYKAAVLNAAVEGSIVESEAESSRRHGLSYETGDTLLRRVTAARQAQCTGRGKYKTPEPADQPATPGTPEGWTWATLEQLTVQIADVDHKMPKATESGVPYVSTKDFTGDDGIDFAGAKRIALADYEALCRKVTPTRGDILLSRYGTVGEVRVVAVDGPFQASYSVAILKPVRGFGLVDFIATAMRSDVVQAQIKRDVRATAQPDLGLAHIRQFIIPLPPLAEQNRIVAEVDRCLSIVREVEAEVDANLKRAQALRQAVLAAAFGTQDRPLPLPA